MRHADILTNGEVANLFGVSSRTIHKWHAEKQLRGYRLPTSGQDRRFTRDEIATFIYREFPGHMHLYLLSRLRKTFAVEARGTTFDVLTMLHKAPAVAVIFPLINFVRSDLLRLISHLTREFPTLRLAAIRTEDGDDTGIDKFHYTFAHYISVDEAIVTLTEERNHAATRPVARSVRPNGRSGSKAKQG